MSTTYHVTDNQGNLAYPASHTRPGRSVDLLSQGGCYVYHPDARGAFTTDFPPDGDFTRTQYMAANKETFKELFPKLDYVKHKGHSGIDTDQCDKESLVQMFLPATGLIGVPVLLRVVLGDIPGSAALTIAGAVAGYAEGKALTATDPASRKSYANIAGDVVSVMGPFGAVQIGASTLGIPDAKVVPIGAIAGIVTYMYFGDYIKESLDVATTAGGFLMGILSWFQSFMEDTICEIFKGAKNVSSNQCTKYVGNNGLPTYAPWSIAETAYAMVTSNDVEPGAAPAAFADQLSLLSYYSNKMEYGQLGGGGCVWQPFYISSSGATEQCGNYDEMVQFFNKKPWPIHTPMATTTPIGKCEGYVEWLKQTAESYSRSSLNVPGNSFRSQAASLIQASPPGISNCGATNKAFLDEMAMPPAGEVITANTILTSSPSATQVQDTAVALGEKWWPYGFLQEPAKAVMQFIEPLSRSGYSGTNYDCTAAYNKYEGSKVGRQFVAAAQNTGLLSACPPPLQPNITTWNKFCDGGKCTLANFTGL